MLGPVGGKVQLAAKKPGVLLRPEGPGKGYEGADRMIWNRRLSDEVTLEHKPQGHRQVDNLKYLEDKANRLV